MGGNWVTQTFAVWITSVSYVPQIGELSSNGTLGSAFPDESKVDIRRARITDKTPIIDRHKIWQGGTHKGIPNYLEINTSRK